MFHSIEIEVRHYRYIYEDEIDYHGGLFMNCVLEM